MILRTRILALASVLTVFFLALIASTLIFFADASSELNRVVERNLAVEQTAESLNSTILNIRSEIWNTMVFDLARRQDHVAWLDGQAKTFYQGLRDLSGRNPDFAATAMELRLRFQGYYQFGSTILEMRTLDEFVSQTKVVEKFRENQIALTDKLAQTLAETKEEFFGAMDKLNDDFAAATLVAFVVAGAVTLLVFFLSVLMARRLALPLERLTQTARAVSSGDYAIRPQPRSIRTGRLDEIGALTDTFTTMLDQIEAYSTRMEDLVKARTDALARTNAVMVKELKLAQKIQAAIIPRQFPNGPLLASGAYLPMEELGGDFYDVFESSPGIWSLVMADVSGHGVPAALVTAMVKISLGLPGLQTLSPGQALDEVNRDLCATIGDLRRYVTAILCSLDMKNHRLSYCNAGHNELIIIRRSGEVETHGPNSGVVGLKSDSLFLTRTVPFEPGDGLLLFTDGLVEARGHDKNPFTVERLIELVRSSQGSLPADLVDQITAEVAAFSDGQPRQDDMAFLAVQWPRIRRAAVAAPTVKRDAEELYRSKEYQELLTWTEASLAGLVSVHERARLFHWQALAQFQLGKPDEAIRAWDQALAVDPDFHRARASRDLLLRHLEVERGV
jgi:serine phosphatase RsbU (regulator of sigma subunit)